jgi:hypothetical protein
VGKPERKRPPGRPRRRKVDNIKMDLREIGWSGMYWTDLAQGRDQWRDFVNTVMNFRVPSNAGNFLSSCAIGGFSTRVQLHELVMCVKITRALGGIEGAEVFSKLCVVMYVLTLLVA